MNLSRVIIENLRGFKHIEVDLDSITVLIGENNTGKSAVMNPSNLDMWGLGKLYSLPS